MPETARPAQVVQPRWLTLLALTLSSAITAIPSLARSACDCACDSYARLVETRGALSPAQEAYLDRCGGACAIAWTRCDRAMASAADSGDTTQPPGDASYTSDSSDIKESPMTDPSRREQFIDSLKTRLDELNSEIASLEERAREASGQAEETYRQQLEEIREKRAELEHKLGDLKAAGEAQFDKLKLEAEHAWKAFQNSVSYFRSHFK
jgi:hypothetical protein